MGIVNITHGYSPYFINSMKIGKEALYAMIISSVLLVVIIIISIVIAFKQTDEYNYARESFELMHSKLDEVEKSLVLDILVIEKHLDSLNNIQVNLSNDFIKYNNKLTESVSKIKRYKNEIIQHDYRDSSSTSIINRLNSK